MCVTFGHDCVMHPRYSLGSADILDVAQSSAPASDDETE